MSSLIAQRQVLVIPRPGLVQRNYAIDREWLFVIALHLLPPVCRKHKAAV